MSRKPTTPAEASLAECRTMLEQFQYAVEHYQGRTTVTAEDVRRIAWLILSLEQKGARNV